MVNQIKYTFSFTGASALIAETLIIAEEYNQLNNWTLVQKSLLQNNSLNKIKEGTFKREFSEIKKRLSNLTPEQLQIFNTGNYDDAKAIILLSLVKTYPFLNDFIIEVVRNKYLLYDNFLSEVDYIKFVNAKSLIHEELNTITDLTARKVKQVVFKLLEQTGLITQAKNGTIIKPYLSSNVVQAITDDNTTYLMSFLYTNMEIKGLSQKMNHA